MLHVLSPYICHAVYIGLPATKQNSSVGASLPNVAVVPPAVSRILPTVAFVVEASRRGAASTEVGGVNAGGNIHQGTCQVPSFGPCNSK
jgi:hypothetical protein